MKSLIEALKQFLFSRNLHTLINFFVSGFLCGIVFTYIANLPELDNVFYERTLKPTLIKEPWYFVFSGFLLLSLMIGFIISSFRNDFHRKLSITKFRMLLAGVVIVGTFPLLNYLFGFLLLAQLFFVFPCAIAMCCLTRNLKMFPVALLVSISTYFVQGLELLLMSPFEPCFKKISITFLADLDSILLFANYSLTFGFWLIWRAKRVKE